MSTPVEISKFSDLTIDRLDLEKLQSKFEKDENYFMGVGVFKNEGKSFTTLINGKLSTNGINEAVFNKKKSYSIGIEFEDEANIVAFDKLIGQVKEFLPGYTVETPVKNDKYYIKLKYEKNKFKASSNVDFTPKKANESGLVRGQQVSATGDLQVWVNVKDKKAGISFDVSKLDFVIEE